MDKRVTITFYDKDDGNITVDADFERDVTVPSIEMSNAERIAAAILYRLNHSPETWLVSDDEPAPEEVEEDGSDS